MSGSGTLQQPQESSSTAKRLQEGSSTAKVFRALFTQKLLAQVPNIETVSRNNPVLISCQELYIQTIITGTRVTTSSKAQGTLQGIDAILGGLPKSLTSTEEVIRTIALSKELREKLEKLQAEKKAALDQRDQMITKQNQELVNILRMLVTQPTAMIGSQPIKQQLNRLNEDIVKLDTIFKGIADRESGLNVQISALHEIATRMAGKRKEAPSYRETLPEAKY